MFCMVKRMASSHKGVALVMMIIFITSFALNAQTIIKLDGQKTQTSIKSSTSESLRIQSSFDALHAFEVKTSEGTFHELIFDNSYSIGSIGTPKLPAVKDLIEIPFGAEVEIKVVGFSEKEYQLLDYGIENRLFPVQPSLRKDQAPEDVPFELLQEAYSKSEFNDQQMVDVEILGVLRGFRIARLVIAPVKYNPLANSIKVFNDIEIEINFKNADYTLNEYIKASTWSPFFDVIQSRLLNPMQTKNIFDDHPDLTKNPVKMVIVSDRIFEETLQPYIEWKTQMGFFVDVAYTDEIGTTANAIKNHIHGIYNEGTAEDPAPTFLVLVGDDNTLPASATGTSSAVVSDLYYASVDGDYFPEMYYGRLSARNTQELQNQIDKILYYEKYEFEDPSYLDKVTLIAGADGSWNPAVGQPTIQYGTQNYYNEDNGFDDVYTYLTSYSGCYDNERISVSLINYTAHCSPGSWSDPSLSVSNVHNMTNEGKYPLAIGNCCQSSQFSVTECIGEAWVRAANKGAVAYIGSSPSTYWFEDFYWSVGAFPISGNNNGYVPSTEETTLGAYDAPFVSDYVTVNALQFVGNLAVTEVDIQNYPQHSSPLYYWEAYHTFGDPSTMIYQTQGSDNLVSHLPILPIGLETYTVNALSGSYVAISKDGILHGAAFVDETGEVEVPIDAVLDGGDVTIVVTKAQYIPYIVTVPAAALEGPFVVLDHFDLEGLANYDETISIDITLKNVGADPAENVTATISGTDPYFTIINPDVNLEFGSILAGDEGNTASVTNAYSFEISKNIPDNYQTTFLLTITDGEDQWTSNLRIKGYAPVYHIDPEFTITETSDGNNGDGHLDPGESATLTFYVTNNGNATAKTPVFELFGSSPYLTIDNELFNLQPIAAGQTREIIVAVNAHSSTLNGTMVDLDLQVEDGHWFETQSTIIIGQLPELQAGNGNAEASNYPFYNYYKANRTQMLYLNSELGAGEKVITELGLDISSVADSYRDLPNFKILIKHVDILEMPASYVDMTNATEVFSKATYSMPTETGWHLWDIENFTYDGLSNLVIEIIWGQLDNWTSTHYKVRSSVLSNPMVSYGYSDNQIVPNYSDNSATRPNLFLSFVAEETEDLQQITFHAIDSSFNPVANAVIKIGSLELPTNNEGIAEIMLYPGDYNLNASAEGFDPIDNLSFNVSEEAQNIEITFTLPFRNVHFYVGDTNGQVVENATITINDQQHEPGIYSIQELEPGSYNYKITADHYYDRLGSFELTMHDIEIRVYLNPDYTVSEEIANPEMRIYPNPAKDNITIKLSGISGLLDYRISNYQGQVLMTGEKDASSYQNQFNINLHGYSAGIYYLRVEYNDGMMIKKIIIE